MLYNCVDSTIIDKKDIDNVSLYTVKDKYYKTISKNIQIDIISGEIDLDILLDEYNIVKITLENYDISDVANNINAFRKNIDNLYVIKCNKLILDSKLIDTNNITMNNLVPYVDYRYINQFKDTINTLVDDIHFNEIIVYLPDKYLWSDIIYDFKSLTKKLKVITSERGLFISSNVEPYTSLRDVSIIRQLWTTFDLVVEIHSNEIGDTLDSTYFGSNGVDKQKNMQIKDKNDISGYELESIELDSIDLDFIEEDLQNYNIDEDENFTDNSPFLEEIEKVEITEDKANKTVKNFYSNYDFLNIEEDNDSKYLNTGEFSNDSIFYQYKIDFSDDDLSIQKEAMDFVKTKDVYWHDIINAFINKTPNIYQINIPNDFCNKYIIPNKINNISNFNEKLSILTIYNNYSYKSSILSDIYDLSLENYKKASIKIKEIAMR